MALTIATQPQLDTMYASQGCCINYSWTSDNALVAGSLYQAIISFASIPDVGSIFYFGNYELTVVSDGTSTNDYEVDQGVSVFDFIDNLAANLDNLLVDTHDAARAGSTLTLDANCIGSEYNLSIDTSQVSIGAVTAVVQTDGVDATTLDQYSVELEITVGSCTLPIQKVFPKVTIDDCDTAALCNQSLTLDISYDISSILSEYRYLFLDLIDDQGTADAVAITDNIADVSVRYREYYLDDNRNIQRTAYQTANTFSVMFSRCDCADTVLAANTTIKGGVGVGEWHVPDEEMYVCRNSRTKACIYLGTTGDVGIIYDFPDTCATATEPVVTFDLINCATGTDGGGDYVTFDVELTSDQAIGFTSGGVSVTGAGPATNYTLTGFASSTHPTYIVENQKSYGDDDYNYAVTVSAPCASYLLRFSYDVQVGGPGEPNCGTVIFTGNVSVTLVPGSEVSGIFIPNQNLTEGYYCFDLTSLMALDTSNASSMTFNIVQDASTAPSSVSTPLVINIIDDDNWCCDVETFYYLDCGGSFQPINLRGSLQHNIQTSGPSFTPCSSCGDTLPNNVNLVPRESTRRNIHTTYKIKDKYKTYKFTETDHHMRTFENFLSSNLIYDGDGDEVYIAKSDKIITRRDNKIEVEVTIFKAQEIKQLNRW